LVGYALITFWRNHLFGWSNPHLWDINIGNLDAQVRYKISAFLALAIKRAKAPYPEAHGRLGFILYLEGDTDEALKHANIALEYDQNSFYAQVTRVAYAIDKILDYKIKIADVVGQGGNWETILTDTYFKGIFAIIKSVKAIPTHQFYKDELLKLTGIYRRTIPHTTNVNDFIEQSQWLMNFGDYIKFIPTFSSRPNLYLEIVKAPIKQLDMKDREEEVEELMILAEGKSELFKP
jgi:tetratricopeptide (TPR) repeat protein